MEHGLTVGRVMVVRPVLTLPEATGTDCPIGRSIRGSDVWVFAVVVHRRNSRTFHELHAGQAEAVDELARGGADTTASFDASGRFRIYLGAAPGVGKTYALLSEGRRRKERGACVVVGFVECHGRRRTEALMENLGLVRPLVVEYRGSRCEEMDLHAVLERHPQVVLVDELARTNVPGSGPHEKRWPDVVEILDAGIEVITTVNIQHLESIADAVERILENADS
jgi:hypothetical protein